VTADPHHPIAGWYGKLPQIPRVPWGTLRALSSVEAFGPLAEGEALRAWGESTGWKGLWWTRGRADGDSLMLGCAGLPTTEEFGRLLESRASRAVR